MSKPKICPLMTAALRTRSIPENRVVFCKKEKCEWWQIYNNGDEPECAIKGITLLANMATHWNTG